MRTIKLIFALLLTGSPIYGQEIVGIVANSKGEPLELVNVLLYETPDSTFVTGTATGTDGRFYFGNLPPKAFYIKLSSIGYHDVVYPADAEKRATYILKENVEILGEITITAAKPVVSIEDGKLTFDVPSLIKQRPVHTAFDVLGEIPGIEKSGNNITIIGAHSTTLIINGRVSSMTRSQIIDFLKSTPPEQIKSVELLYATPPKYGVKGSSVNIVMDNYRKEQRENKARLGLQGSQAHHFSPSANVNFSSAGSRSLLNATYSFRYDKDRPTEDLEAVHLLENKEHSVVVENVSKSTYKAHNVGLAYDYDLKNKDAISFAYNGRISDPDIRRNGWTAFDTRNVQSTNKTTGPSNLHTVSADYTHANLSIGADYSYYNSKDDQLMVYTEASAADSIVSGSEQTVNRGAFHVNNQHKFSGKQVFSYGMNAKTSRSENSQLTYINEQTDNAFSLKQSEYTVDGFAGWVQPLGEKITINGNLTLEYFKATVNSGSIKRTLWEKWSLYPTVSMTWKIAPMKMLQFSLSSEKSYPTYWQTTPNVTYMNAYTSIEGNPEVKPARIYSSNLNFILKGKYVFQLFGNFASDYIQQLMYQSPEKLQATYKIINLDKRNIVGALAVVPFKAGGILDSRVVLQGFLIHNKGVLEDISFDRKKLYGRISMNNTFYLNETKNLSLQVNGFYATKAIQGIYDIRPMYGLSVGGVWNVNNRLTITIMGNDLLDGQKARTITDLQGQNYRQTIYHDTRNVSASVRYTIGGYKDRKAKSIDTSRFGI